MFVMLTARMHGILRHSNKDAVLILLSLVYATLLFSFPSAPLIALGLWWIANTVAHNFIHTPAVIPACAGMTSREGVQSGHTSNDWVERLA